MNELRSLFNKYKEEREYVSGTSPATIKTYTACFENFCKRMPHIEHPSQIKSETLTTFFKILRERKRLVGKHQEQGVKASTVATYFSKLKGFFQWLEANNYVEKNPFRDIKPPKESYDDIRYLTKNQVQRILMALEYGNWGNKLVKARNKAIIGLGLYAGLRRGEMLGLNLIDIDLQNGKLTVPQSISKSKMTREVPIHSNLHRLLKDYINERKRRHIKHEALLVGGTGNDRFTQHGLKHTMKKINKESGLRFHAHQLRHTFAVNIIMTERFSAFELQQLMGHADIRMTARYVRRIPVGSMRDKLEEISYQS